MVSTFDAGAYAAIDTTDTLVHVTGVQPDVEARSYTTRDGEKLGYFEYSHSVPSKTAFVYLHGIESHSMWFHSAALEIQQDGYDLYLLDRRGSGVNRESQGFVSGHIGSKDQWLADVHDFVAPIRDRHQRVYLIGLSWGGKLAMAYLMSHSTMVDGVVLITPGLKSRVTLPFFSKMRLIATRPFSSKFRFDVPIRPEMFTTTPQHLVYIRQDDRRLHNVTGSFLWENLRLDRDIDKSIETVKLPILLFLAGQDQIIDNDGVTRLLHRAANAAVTVRTYEDQTHSIQFDAPKRLANDIDSWISSAKRSESNRPHVTSQSET